MNKRLIILSIFVVLALITLIFKPHTSEYYTFTPDMSYTSPDTECQSLLRSADGQLSQTKSLVSRAMKACNGQSQQPQPPLPYPQPPQPQPPSQGQYIGKPLNQVIQMLRRQYPGAKIVPMESRQLAVSRYSDTFMNNNILVIWKWGSRDVYISNPMLRSREFGVNQQVVTQVMIPKKFSPYNPGNPPNVLPPLIVDDDIVTTMQPPNNGVTNDLPTYKPPVSNAPKANIPSWLQGQTSQVVVNYLKVLNPGFTIVKIPEGGMVTADYRPNRIRVTYNSSI
jgi:hypothetical protein